jgi:hypothetical protein
MITEPRREAKRVLAGAVAAMFVWFGGMAALALVVQPSAVIVFGPSANLAAAIEAADASILSVGQGFVTAKGDRAGFTKRLYAGGAWFVWPALPAFCGRNKRAKG